MRLILFLIAPLFLFSQEPGFISGKIEDKNGVGLPGVNIMLKGTYYGTASDSKGNYKIDKIQPGNYDLELSMIGYKIILKTGVKEMLMKPFIISCSLKE